MKKFEYENFVIEILKEDQYTLNSTDNVNIYEKIFLSDEESRRHSSPFGIKYLSPLGIKIFRHNEELSRCLLIPSHSGVYFGENSLLVEENRILICWGDCLFCLSIPKLNLIWKTKADYCTCFQLFKIKDSYITHGELNISRINKNGEILWQFGGRDIFVSVDGTDIFEIHSDHILVSDWTETVYKLNFDGKLLDEFPT